MVPSSCAARPATSVTSLKNYIPETPVWEPQISTEKVHLCFNIFRT